VGGRRWPVGGPAVLSFSPRNATSGRLASAAWVVGVPAIACAGPTD